MQNQIIQNFILLAEGKMTAEEWKKWFAENDKNVETVCGRLNFLKIKPTASFSDIRNAHIGQTSVVKWLKSKNITPLISDKYQKDLESEFKYFRKSENEKEKLLRKTFENQFRHLQEAYPRFFKQLTKSYSNSNIIEKGVSQKLIEDIEKELSVKFSENLKEFFLQISKFQFESIFIYFDDLYTETINKKKYVVLGEFWKYGDGDKLLYDVENHGVFVLAHEFSPPKIIKQSNTFKEFVENKITYHLREYN